MGHGHTPSCHTPQSLPACLLSSESSTYGPNREKVIGLTVIGLVMQHHDLIIQLHFYRDSPTRIYKVEFIRFTMLNTKVKGIYGQCCSMNFSNNCKVIQTCFDWGF